VKYRQQTIPDTQALLSHSEFIDYYDTGCLVVAHCFQNSRYAFQIDSLTYDPIRVERASFTHSEHRAIALTLHPKCSVESEFVE